MPVDARRAIDELKELRALTGDADGAQRLAWTEVWLKSRRWFAEKTQGLPLERHMDAAGNQWFTLAGESERALLLGSHLDSVPNGGWLDGSLGMLAALTVLRHLAERHAGKPPLTIRVVDWADEEGARFGRSLFGSSAFAGTHSIAADRVRTDRAGMTMEQALAVCGVSMDKVGDAARERRHAAAYLELHIEQGPLLETAQLPLASVLGTKGVERHAVTFHGQESHAGSTPMHVRRDALAAAAKLALEVRAIAQKNAGAVCTVGSLKTSPGVPTVIAGQCEATLDQRDLDARVLAGMLQDAREASERIATEEGCRVEWSRIWGIEPVPFDATLIELCNMAIRETAGTGLQLPSGPLHDAAEVSRSGIPTAMMFVQSKGGISHNKVEDTEEQHLELALQAFDLLASKTINWLVRAS